MAAPEEFRDNYYFTEPFYPIQSKTHRRIFIATDLFYDLLIAARARDDVPALAVSLENSFGSVKEIMNISCRRLEKCFDIGTELAVNIKVIGTVFEKYRKSRKKKVADVEKQSIESIFKMLEKEIAGLPEESFAYIFTSSSGETGRVHFNSREHEFSSPIVISEVIRNAILEDACEVFCAHNHPTGSEPSEHDYQAAQILRCRLDAYSVKLDNFFFFTPDSPGKSGKNISFESARNNLLGKFR